MLMLELHQNAVFEQVLGNLSTEIFLTMQVVDMVHGWLADAQVVFYGGGCLRLMSSESGGDVARGALAMW